MISEHNNYSAMNIVIIIIIIIIIIIVYITGIMVMD